MRKRIKCMILVIAILLCALLPTGQNVLHAAGKTLGIGQAKALGLANSTDYQRQQSKILLKEVSYKQAVKALQLKRKNKTTFRWSPVLNFSFPEDLNLEEESEYVYKPTQLQSEIRELKHRLDDLKFEVYEEVSNLFVEIYAYQEEIAFQEEQLETLYETLDKNEARMILGQAQQSDIDAINGNINKINISLAENKRGFENAKEEMGDLINLDISTQYRFLNPYVEMEVPRDRLEQLVEYTLANDQSYYEAKMATQLALLQLDTNYDLMKKQYGSDMNLISSYVQQVKNGEKIDGSAFKLSYDKFLQKIDEPWTGTMRILFVKIPKEWFKGEIDGVRYVEDEPYVLYENALEYQDVLAEQKQLAVDIEKQVRESFESQVSARNSYEATVEQAEKEKKNLDKLKTLNQLGECTFEEYTEAQSQYEELLLDSLEALELYTTLIYSFNRLTCGAISLYLKGESIDVTAATGADSYIVEEQDGQEGARYYIVNVVEDQVFEIGVYIPEDFETDISHFEFWCDGIQLGVKTEIGKKIRHLALSTGMVNEAVIRLYNDDEVIADCEIDVQSYEGPLEIPGEYLVVKAEEREEVGMYRTSLNNQTSLMEITLDFDVNENVYYYSLQNKEGQYLFSNEPITVRDSFQYLTILNGALSSITVNCYDENKNLMYQALFDTENYTLYKKVD